jgi:hypothetical protein
VATPCDWVRGMPTLILLFYSDDEAMANGQVWGF